MVLCLVTLTDVYTGRAGLSASAELLVEIFDYKNAVWIQSTNVTDGPTDIGRQQKLHLGLRIVPRCKIGQHLPML